MKKIKLNKIKHYRCWTSARADRCMGDLCSMRRSQFGFCHTWSFANPTRSRWIHITRTDTRPLSVSTALIVVVSIFHDILRCRPRHLRKNPLLH